MLPSESSQSTFQGKTEMLGSMRIPHKTNLASEVSKERFREKQDQCASRRLEVNCFMCVLNKWTG